MAKVKTGFIADTFERTNEELIRPTGKGVTKALKDTFNPQNLIEQVFSLSPQETSNTQIEKGQADKNKSTPLNLEKLQKIYKNQDTAKAEVLANRFFHRAKSEEERFFEESGGKKQQKIQSELYQKEQKKRQEEQNIKKQQLPEPRGKLRRSIFSAKKIAKREQVETKPASGKQ